MQTRARGKLLEREPELEALQDGLGRAGAGDGALILIQGPPGVGKTELMREARAAAGRAGLTALEAKASELEQPFAFGIVRQLLEPVISRAPEQSDLFSGAAAPAARLFEADDRETSRSDADFDALDSLYWLIVNLCDLAPVLVAVDDCQWSDVDSLRFLSYLGQRIEGLRAAMLLAGRPPEGPDAVTAALWSQIAARPEAIALYPRTLSEPAAVALARDRLGSEAEEEFCRACHTATGGNPLFLRELLGALDSAGVAPSATAASQVQAVGPTAVARFVLHRVSALGPSASELASAVAVLGDNSELSLVASVSGLSMAEARTAADALVRADIFADSPQLGFVHPIVRAALYEDLAPGERQARHAAAAQALATRGASAERVTAHLLLTSPTGDSGRVRTLRSAAAAAAGRGAPAVAAARLRRALEESPGDQERAELLTDLGGYEIAAMQFAAAEEHLVTVVESDAELSTRAEAASWLARCVVVSGSRAAEPAFDLVSSVADELVGVDRERALELGADVLMMAASSPALRPRMAPHLKRFTEQAHGASGFEAVARIHTALERLVDGAPAQPVADELEAALATGLPPASAINAGFLAVHGLRAAERYEVPMRLLDLGLEGARREGHTARQGLIHAQRAAIALTQGSLQDAQVEAETGLRLVAPGHFSLLLLLAISITVHVERDELDAAEELTRRDDAAGGVDRLYADQYLTARGRLRIARGQASQGLADLLACGQGLQAAGVRFPTEWRVWAVPTLLALGDDQQAQALAAQQLATCRRFGAPRALGMALRTAAQLATDAERLTLLQEAVSVLEPSTARLELAYGLTDLGAALIGAGQLREGRDKERRAIEVAQHCGAVTIAETARTALRAGPGRRARVELTGPNSLTAAESRVCRQAADGHTNREIAQALFVTEKTVERHLSSAYQKLGIRSRFQLAAALGR